MKTFTPGPWTHTKSVCGGDVCFDIHQVEIDGKWVPGSDVAYSQFFKTYASEKDAVQDANAQLIAAAPELLAACQAFVVYDNDDAADGIAMMLNYEKARTAIHAAIAKATGAAA